MLFKSKFLVAKVKQNGHPGKGTVGERALTKSYGNGHVLLFFILLLLNTLSQGVLAQKAETYEINIQKQALSSALTSFREQTNVQIAFKSEELKGINSLGVNCNMTAEAALQTLLEDSGLEYRFTTPQTVVIEASTKTQTESETPLVLSAIVVTGELQERSILETGNSVAVITDADLLQRNINSFDDVIMRTPGFSSQGDNFGISIRGVPIQGISGSADFGDTITFEVDGVRQTAETISTSLSNLFDTKQVEVFRGGQSTSRGAASIAGAIEISTNDPSFEREAQIQFGAKYNNTHNSAGYSFNVMGNQPINDNWAFRAVATIDDFDGYVFNEFRNEDNDEQRLDQARVKLRYRNDAGTLNAITTVNFTDSSKGYSALVNPEQNLAYPGVPEISERIRNSNVDEFFNNEVRSIAQNLNWVINEQYALSATVSHLQSESDTFFDRDGSPAQLSDLRSVGETTRNTAEVKLTYEDDTQNYILGVYMQKEDAPSTLAANQDFSFIFPGATLIINGNNEAERTNAAIFGEYERLLSDKFSVRGGLRYDYEEQELSAELDNTIQTPIGDLPGPLQPNPPGDTDYTALLPSLSATYTIDTDQTLTLLLKQDYRAGGIQFNVTGGTEFEPEYANTAELAWRKVTDNISIQTNLYYTQWEDMQISATVELPGFGDVGIVDNAGEASQFGVEFEVDYNLSRQMQTYASFAYNRTYFDEYIANALRDPPIDYSGNEFPFAPRLTANIGFTWFINDNLSWDTNVNYEGRRFRNAFNAPGDFQESYVVANTIVRYALEDWYGSVWINNITDADFITNARNDGPASTPRTFGVIFGTNF